MRGEREQIAHAMSGSRIICPTKPIITGFGRSAISEKSAGLSAKPKSNIKSVSIGSTIKIVFMLLTYCRLGVEAPVLASVSGVSFLEHHYFKMKKP